MAFSPATGEEIRKLWRTKTFPGAFSGLANFKVALATNKNIQISSKQLFSIMKTDEDFILETKRRRKRFNRRKLIVHGFATVWQSDVGIMPEFNSYVAFLCCIDLFSRNIYCAALKTKTAEEVQKKFKEIFSRVGFKPNKLETDRGSEYVGSKDFFQKEEIYLTFKVGRNKASFAEHAIQVCN